MRIRMRIAKPVVAGRITNTERYLNDISRIKILSPAEQVKLAKTAQSDPDPAKRLAARNKLIESNLRYAFKKAKRYAGRGMPLDDIVQEGNEGIWKSLLTFDKNKGGVLTHAHPWIRQRTSRAVAQANRVYKLPAYLIDRSAKLRKVSSRLCQEYKREPTIEEIAREADMPVKQVQRALLDTQFTLSLEAPLKGEDAPVKNTGNTNQSLSYYLKDDTVPHPDEEAFLGALRKDIEKALTSLTKSERIAVVLRFGLDEGPERKFDEIKAVLHLSPEGARQAVIRGINKLFGNRILREYLERIPLIEGKKKGNVA
jgi:RNA polymerase primary sigma factor